MITANIETVAFVNPQHDTTIERRQHPAGGTGMLNGEAPTGRTSRSYAAKNTGVTYVLPRQKETPRLSEYDKMMINMAQTREVAGKMVAIHENADAVWFGGREPWSDEKREAEIDKAVVHAMYLENGTNLYRKSDIYNSALQSLDQLQATRVGYYDCVVQDETSDKDAKSDAATQLAKIESNGLKDDMMLTRWALQSRPVATRCVENKITFGKGYDPVFMTAAHELHDLGQTQAFRSAIVVM